MDIFCVWRKEGGLFCWRRQFLQSETISPKGISVTFTQDTTPHIKSKQQILKTLLSMMKCLCYHHNERCQSYFRLGLRMGSKLSVLSIQLKSTKMKIQLKIFSRLVLNSILAKMVLQRLEKKTLICRLTKLWILK